jgi:solute carrier family 35 protein E1
MESEDVFNGLKLVLVCFLWYISSATGNIIGKLVLTEFPYPMTVTLVQLVSAAVYLGPILRVLGVPHTGNVPKRYYFSMVIPLALGKFLASLSSHVSIWIVSVSYAHTGK